MTPGDMILRGGGGLKLVEGWWVCFVKKIREGGGGNGVFEVLEGDLGSFGGFGWLCFVEEGRWEEKKVFRGAGGTGFLHNSSATRVMEWWVQENEKKPGKNRYFPVPKRYFSVPERFFRRESGSG